VLVTCDDEERSANLRSLLNSIVELVASPESIHVGLNDSTPAPTQKQSETPIARDCIAVATMSFEANLKAEDDGRTARGVTLVKTSSLHNLLLL